MKKFLALAMVSTLLVTALVGCGSEPKVDKETTEASQEVSTDKETTEASQEVSTDTEPTELVVVTSYSGDDGNRENYEKAFKAFEEESGHTVLDASATSNEEWKAKVMTDFETGSEPDVLFYFTGVDANKIIEGEKVVSIDTIRAEYPDYASNMKDDLLPKSLVDEVSYAVPVNGFWEGLFVNKTVLEESGVEMPGADYTWEQFLADCEKIKEAGFTPIAASLQEVPHYWFEFTTFNNGNLSNHLDIPETASDEIGTKWVSGLEDMKELYTKGYFPSNTLTASDPEAVQMMADNEAAFLIDGSWKMGWFSENTPDDLDNFAVTYVPGKNDRVASDMIGGLSMGYYITEKAWNNPTQRKAAVDFVMAMTSDEVVSTFGATAVTALKNGTVAPDNLNSLELSAIEMTKGATGVVGAAQDGLNVEARTDMFSNVKNVVTDNMTAEEAITKALELK